MSGLKRTINQYRVGEDWRANFKHINYPNVEASLRAILNAEEPVNVYDRLGNITAHVYPARPISLDEKIFRIAVLMDSQYEVMLKESA